MKKITLVRLVMDIDIARMCQYQREQFIQAIRKRLNEYRKQYEEGTLKPDATLQIDLPPSH